MGNSGEGAGRARASGLEDSGPIQSVDRAAAILGRIPALAVSVRRAAAEASRRLGWTDPGTG